MENFVNYEDVVLYEGKSDVWLIDVRKPDELKETGTIPFSINIPIGMLGDELKNMKPDEFTSKYGRELPLNDSKLVFYCNKGGRAKKAMEAAIELGFTKSKFYKGSWTDWATHQQ